MGMRATVTVIDAKSFQKLSADPKADVSLAGKSFDIDKVWLDFHDAFVKLGEPLCYALEGELCPYGNFADNDTGGFDGFVSPKRAAQIAAALEKLSLDDVLGALEPMYKKRRLGSPADDEEKKTYLKQQLSTLLAAYRMAAKKKAAVYIGIC